MCLLLRTAVLLGGVVEDVWRGQRSRSGRLGLLRTFSLFR